MEKQLVNRTDDVGRSKECSFDGLRSVAQSKRRRRVSRNRTIALLRRQKIQDRPGLRSLLPRPGSRLGQLLREDQKDHREKLTARRKRRKKTERGRGEQRQKTRETDRVQKPSCAALKVEILFRACSF